MVQVELVNLDLFLLYLLGKEVSLSSSMAQINSRFGGVSLVGKQLLVLEDENLYLGQEPRKLRNIITGDPMEAEQKYKQSFMFTPNCFLIITSNVL
jgi:phage/plasmid-associated DNA primase